MTDKKVQGWERIILSSMDVEMDSTHLYNGKSPLLIKQEQFDKMKFPLYATLQRSVLLPNSNNDSILVSITCQSHNLAKANLIISGFDKQENHCYSDTLPIDNRDEWHTFSKKVPAKNISILHLNIKATGLIEAPEQKLWLDKITMYAGKQNIMEYPEADLSDSIHLSSKDICPLSFSDSSSYTLIPELRDKKIIAFAETVHGSQTINESVIQLIKNQIEHNNCKLVLLELPIEKMLSINRYVQGDENFQLDSIKTIIQKSLYSDSMIDFLVWLKNYNRNLENKIWMLGTDYNPWASDGGLNLAYFLLTSNASAKNLDLYKICNLLLKNGSNDQNSRNDGLNKIVQALDNIDSTKNIINEKEVQIIQYYLNNETNREKKTSLRLTLRDKFMFENLKFLSSLLCPSPHETITIYTHLGHANYISSNSWDRSPSLGKYAKTEFKDDYLCIGIFTSQGQILSTDNVTGKIVVKNLMDAPKNSIEHLLSNASNDYYYLKADRFPARPFFTRPSGNIYLKDMFDIINPVSRMEGMIYIKQSKEIKKSSEIINRKTDVDTAHFERYLKIRNELKGYLKE